MTDMNNDQDLQQLLNTHEGSHETVVAEPGAANNASRQQDLKFLHKIPVNITLEVASTEISLGELMEVDASSVITLDKLAGEPLDMKVNGTLFAKAEVVVFSGNYGLRVIERVGEELSGLIA